MFLLGWNENLQPHGPLLDQFDTTVLGHCNFADIKKLRNVVDGMDIKEEGKNPIPCCELCTQAKFVQTWNRGQI